MMNWNTCFTNARFGQEYRSAQARTAYERDFDRLIFSAAFRRLQDKTQVFPLPGPVLVHNRLTHSLEVASVGRSLGKLVGQELAELADPAAREFYQADLSSVIAAACLAHDIGNPAFGHSGESAISAYFTDAAAERLNGISLREHFNEAEWQDLTHFEGNANSFRILTHHYANRQQGGYQLTYSTLAAIAKYPCASLAADGSAVHRKKYGFFQSEQESFRKVAETLGMQPEQENPLVFRRHPFVYLVEAADDICYRVIDWEDAHRIGILDSRTAVDALVNLLKTGAEERMDRIYATLDKLKGDSREQLAFLRAMSINLLVETAVRNFMKNESALLTGMYNRSLLDDVEPAMGEALKEINSITVKRIYNHETVVKIELAGYEVMHSLLSHFIPAVLNQRASHREKKVLQLLPDQYRESGAGDYGKALNVVDFIAGMTDSYAMELYKNLHGISLPSHT
jgi:dGTPase